MCSQLVIRALSNLLFFAKLEDKQKHKQLVKRIADYFSTGMMVLYKNQDVFAKQQMQFINYCEPFSIIPLLLYVYQSEEYPSAKSVKQVWMSTFGLPNDQEWDLFLQKYAKYLTNNLFYGASGFNVLLQLYEK